MATFRPLTVNSRAKRAASRPRACRRASEVKYGLLTRTKRDQARRAAEVMGVSPPVHPPLPGAFAEGLVGRPRHPSRRSASRPGAPGDRQARFADGEVVVPREHQMEGLAVGAHPLRREAGRLAGADVPFLGEIN